MAIILSIASEISDIIFHLKPSNYPS